MADTESARANTAFQDWILAEHPTASPERQKALWVGWWGCCQAWSNDANDAPEPVADMADDEKRTQGPELGGQTRLDIIETSPGLYELAVVNVAESQSVGEPHRRQDLTRVILTLAGTLRRASEHERDPAEEMRRIEAGLAEIEGNYARPDYPRHLLVKEIEELRARENVLEAQLAKAQARIAELLRGIP